MNVFPPIQEAELREVAALLTESENIRGAERAEFVRSGMAAIEQAYGKA
jgi:hypothetical protein